MLDKNLVQDVLTAALATGGDMAELFVENSELNTVIMINGLVEKANWGVDYGCGIRIICGHNAIYAYTNRLDKDNLIKVAAEAAQAAAVLKNGQTSEVNKILPLERLHWEHIHPVAIMPDTVVKKDIVSHLRTASDSAYAYDKLITQTSGNYMSVIQDVLIANSKGLWAEDCRVRTRVATSAVASSANEKQTGRHSPGAMKGFELLNDLDMAFLGKDAARAAVTMLKADHCPSGRMPVVIENGFGGVVFHEACAHSLEATSVAKKASVFTDRLGEAIASPLVTAIDDGTLPNQWGSIHMDDEGTPTKRNVLIENGVLKSYMVDYLNGLKMNTPSTGSARRESYKFAPTSRMTNTYIANGKSTPEAVIADTEYGLYAKTMGGGSVQPATGEFNFAVEEAYLIRNGKIAEPVRGATLIGKGAEILPLIDKVANNLEQAQGVCGSVSGAVPTNVGQPMIRVKEMTVGGRS
ncbi:MAG: TldD/PmbA family protein [Defluviitaleaceae bacterium]|nr:TldD/PmbA family protein [Defluviitaleaceae bacterium]